METVITAYVLCACLKTFGMTTLDDQPSVDLINSPKTVWTQIKDERKSLLTKLSQRVIEKFIQSSYNNPVEPSRDGVYEYTKSLLSIDCVYLLFKDAIKKGDGMRLLDYYCYLMPIFINSGRRNYAIEAFNLLCQYHYDLPPQQAQLIWSRFVNTAGRKGGNIAADLHLEHLNRALKGTIRDLGANKNEKAIVPNSKALGILKGTLEKYDQENSIVSPSEAHAKPGIKKELNAIIAELQQHQSFDILPGRKHSSFGKSFDIIHMRPAKEVLAWLTEHLEKCYFKQTKTDTV